MSAAGSETVATGAPTPPPLHRRLRGGRRLRDGHTLYWWMEIAFVGIFYFVYSTIRNLNDADKVDAFRTRGRSSTCNSISGSTTSSRSRRGRCTPAR